MRRATSCIKQRWRTDLTICTIRRPRGRDYLTRKENLVFRRISGHLEHTRLLEIFLIMGSILSSWECPESLGVFSVIGNIRGCLIIHRDVLALQLFWAPKPAAPKHARLALGEIETGVAHDICHVLEHRMTPATSSPASSIKSGAMSAQLTPSSPTVGDCCEHPVFLY